MRASVHPRAPPSSGCREAAQHASMTFTCKMNEGSVTGAMCAPVHRCVTTHDMHRCVVALTTRPPHHHLSTLLLSFHPFHFYFSCLICVMSLRMVVTLTLFMQLCPAVFIYLTICEVHKQSRGVHNSCLYVWDLLYANFCKDFSGATACKDILLNHFFLRKQEDVWKYTFFYLFFLKTDVNYHASTPTAKKGSD